MSENLVHQCKNRQQCHDENHMCRLIIEKDFDRLKKIAKDAKSLEHPVKDYMSKELITVDADMDIDIDKVIDGDGGEETEASVDIDSPEESWK